MTEAPPRAETQKRTQSDEEAAAAIGAAVASSASASVVAPAVLGVLPLPVLLLYGGQVAALIASSVATLAVQDPPEMPKPSGPESSADAVAEFYEELVFRGLYTLSAARRLISAMSEGKTLEERRALIRGALSVERQFFEQHLEAQRRRSRARQSGREAVARWGTEVSWVHGHPKEPRPTHLAANGRNFRPANGPPVLTGVLPGVLPGCTCTYGPPKQGAEVLASGRNES